MKIDRLWRSVAVGVVLVLWCPPSAHATATKCRAAIIAASTKRTAGRIKVLGKCWDQIAIGKVFGSCPDFRAEQSLEKLDAKVDQSIAKACGGKDKVCGVGSSPDEPLAAIGWNLGNCSALGDASCDRPLADCSDIAPCLGCIADHAVDQFFDLFYDASLLGAAPKSLRPCLRAVGKTGALVLAAVTNGYAACWQAVNKADSGGSFSCPDVKALIVAAASKKGKLRALCDKCGGPTKSCGGPDDVTPAALGFPATCPAVGSCAGPVQTLRDVANCGDCVASFLMDAAVRATIPSFTSPPPQCQQVPASLTPPR